MIHHFEEELEEGKKSTAHTRNSTIHSSSLSALIECVALAQTSELGRQGAF